MRRSSSSKLTLTVDPEIVRRAKAYASSHHISVSGLVEAYLKHLTATDESNPLDMQASWPPTTRTLFGSLRLSRDFEADPEELKRRHLLDKYLHG